VHSLATSTDEVVSGGEDFPITAPIADDLVVIIPPCPGAVCSGPGGDTAPGMFAVVMYSYGLAVLGMNQDRRSQFET
jgi:hypothetical protein